MSRADERGIHKDIEYLRALNTRDLALADDGGEGGIQHYQDGSCCPACAAVVRQMGNVADPR